MCSALLWFHALTGCDSTSSLVRIGKKTGWDVLKHRAPHQDALQLVGQQQGLDERTTAKVEAYICCLDPESNAWFTFSSESKSMYGLRHLEFFGVDCRSRFSSH